MKYFRYLLGLCVLLFTTTACDISDDVPYPIVNGQITEFEVEGQCGPNGESNYSAVIDKTMRTVTLYVADTVDLTRLRVTKIKLKGTSYNPDVDYTYEPTLLADSAACDDFRKFPKKGFDQPYAGQNTYIDFSNEVKFVVTTFQDYEWTVRVTQVVKREIEVENQVGQAVIDVHQRNAVVYVNSSQSLRKLKVLKFSLGGEHGRVTPDPTTYETYDFYNQRQFLVQTGWGRMEYWTVVVYHTDATQTATAEVFARNVNATVSGEKPNGVLPVVEYTTSGDENWMQVPNADIKTTATTYEATITGLHPDTKYQYRVSVGENTLEPQEFSTVAIQQVPNAGFDDWSIDANNAKIHCPWAEGDESYWDTGNRGATTVGNSNSVPTDDTSLGYGKAAYLESKWIVIKFAAGNIFTGKYLKTDGTNGILGFGRPFTAFPSKLTFDYKYNSAEINKIGDTEMSHLQGRPDSCNVYITLWHIDEGEYEEFQDEKYPIVIRTKPGKDRRLFSPNDDRVIAYGQFTQGNTVSDWTTETIDLNYKNTMIAPTHIQIVATSSKYGDYFTGGVGSVLVLDNMQLIYD